MILERGKKKCDCGNVAVWLYMPGYANNDNPYICDDCIGTPDDIGCSCNWHYGLPQEGLPTDEPEGIKEEDGYWQYIDERGRPYPCNEYEYDEDGFTDYTWLGEKVANLDMRFYFFKERIKRKFKNWWKRNIADYIPKHLEDNF